MHEFLEYLWKERSDRHIENIIIITIGSHTFFHNLVSAVKHYNTGTDMLQGCTVSKISRSIGLIFDVDSGCLSVTPSFG